MAEAPIINAPEISVIVPVYKVEKYLAACVDSILAQSFRDFELILVDDGSPDRCGEMCDEFARKDLRIRVVHQENRGLSGARNSGMDIAKGEYITFVDSDDMLVQNGLQLMLAGTQVAGSEITSCVLKEFTDDNEPNLPAWYDGAYSLTKANGRDACIAMYRGTGLLPINACGKLFRKDLIGDTRFPVGRLHEDQAFIPLVCYNAQTVAVIDAPLYQYRYRDDSITRERFTLKRYDDIWAIDNCIAFLKEKNEPEIVKAAEGKRKRLLAVYSIYARRDGVEVPKEYRVGLLSALTYLRKNVDPLKYEYYLAQVSPKLAKAFAYERKLNSMLKRK